MHNWCQPTNCSCEQPGSCYHLQPLKCSLGPSMGQHAPPRHNLSHSWMDGQMKPLMFRFKIKSKDANTNSTRYQYSILTIRTCNRLVTNWPKAGRFVYIYVVLSNVITLCLQYQRTHWKLSLVLPMFDHIPFVKHQIGKHWRRRNKFTNGCKVSGIYRKSHRAIHSSPSVNGCSNTTKRTNTLAHTCKE